MRLSALLGGLICLVLAGGVRAGGANELAGLLRLDEVIEVLRDEGVALGAELDRDMLAGQGSTFWARQVAQVYDKDHMADALRAALAKGMNDAEIAASMAFFASLRGQRILSLETSARRAMADPEIEAIAGQTYAGLKGSDDQRLALITRLIDVNDLVERNVTGSLNSSYYFMRGLVDGGASEMSEDQITADVWAGEGDLRADAQVWLFGFMLLAYRPLGDDDLEAYIAFSGTVSGQALNAALFDGFDDMFITISHTLGVLVGEATGSSDL